MVIAYKYSHKKTKHYRNSAFEYFVFLKTVPTKTMGNNLLASTTNKFFNVIIP